MTGSKTNLALSGGGFNALTSHMGLLAAGMDSLSGEQRDNDLDNLLGNVTRVSSSSGGSWLVPMLGYSDAFRKQFESKAARDGVTTTGYIGQFRKLFESFGFKPDGSIKIPEASGVSGAALKTLAQGLEQLRQVSQKAGALVGQKNFLDMLLFLPQMAATTVIKSGLNWGGFVDNYVNKPMGLDTDLQTKTLESSRNAWAADVDFVMGGTMLTSPAVLGAYGTLARAIAMASAKPTTAGVISQRHFTPISFISRAGVGGAAPKTSALFTAGPFSRTYTGEILGVAKKYRYDTTIPANLNNQLNLRDVSVISSAAAATLAGPETMFDAMPKAVQTATRASRNEIGNLFRNFAPDVAIKDGSIGRVPVIDKSNRNTQMASQLGISRLADSGYVDNSSVGFNLRDIQDTQGTDTPFKLVLWMASNEVPDSVTGLLKRVRTGPDATSLSSFGLASEVPALFGQSQGNGQLDGDSVVNPQSAPGLPIYVPSAKLFDPSAWYGKQAPDWSYSKGNVDISYHKLNVKTVDNKTFGIKGGQSGTLHIFSSTNKKSFAAPLYYDHLNNYNENYDTIRAAFASPTGSSYLKAALAGL